MACNCVAKRNDSEENKHMEMSKNAGFSLVEVMLAMAILAILTISLLNYFGTSLSYNTKMASSQKATLLAQEIAEQLKGQDTLIQKDDESANEEYTVPYLIDKKFVIEDSNLNEEDLSNGKVKGTGKIRFIGKAEDTRKDYDVTIDLESKVKPRDKTENMYGFDSKNSILATDEDQDEDALMYFKMKYSSYCDEYKEKHNGVEVSNKLTDAEIKKKTKRTIDIEISKESSEIEYTVNIKYAYIFTKFKPDDSSASFEYNSNILVDKKISELKKIFILYHPFNMEDYMNINNTTTDIKTLDALYLVAQKKTSDDNFVNNYKMNITGLNGTQIYSNIGTGESDSNNSQILENGVAAANVNKLLSDDFAYVHTVNFEISVYEKGKAGTADAKPYITIKGTKGEQP